MDHDISAIFKGLINSNPYPVVVCNLEFRIIYMNDCAIERYKKQGGKELVGKLLTSFFNPEAISKADMVVEWFKESKDNNRVFCYHNDEFNTDNYLVAIRDENGELMAFTGIHESRTPDTETPYKMD